MRILHLLQWNINSIISNLDMIKNQGFDTIQISPIQGTKETNNEFWVLYQPTNFKIGNYQVGSKEDLINLCKEAKKYNLKIIVDIVLRHTANDSNNWLKPNDNIDYELKNKDFFKEEKNIEDYSNRWQCINLSTNLPLLNYNNKNLQDIYIRFLDELKYCGVSGFRIDMAKHFALPYEGSNFYSRVIQRYNDLVVYGEVINTTKEIIDMYCDYIMVATDGYGTYKDKTITWIESHDDYLTWGWTKKLSEYDINNEYHNLCKNYKNTLYYVRPFSNSWKEEIVRISNFI